MAYTVIFDPTNEHYKALRKLGSALERSEYPVVSRCRIPVVRGSRELHPVTIHAGLVA